MAIAPERMGIGIHRHFTTEGVHPYDQVAWERRDARITNYATGAVAFEQLGVEVPETWSVNATNILAQKYFRGTLGMQEREWSLKQVADRVADTITAWGVKDGYFEDEDEAEAFLAELKYLVVTQRAAFNSPVWFNIGVKGVPQQASACQPYHALVCTPDGLIPIGSLVEEHAVGAKVFDAQGLTKVVAVKENGIKRVLRIRTRAGLLLDVTPDHLVWRDGPGTPGFVEAGMIWCGDQLSWHATSDEAGPGAPLGKPVSVESVEDLGEMPVYDIQTESGEYLSGNLRVHNCFILSVDDTMDSILNWYAEEGIIFKGGSGAGINLSKIRSSREGLQGGGTASGPVSFMRGADASAGTIKSGGKTRRAAKMVILDADHPDIEDFIWCKAIEERKARALRDAGFDMDLDGKDSYSIQYQNANNSVRVTDEFMQAVLDDEDWHLYSVTTGDVLQTTKARDLFRQIAKAAWECADPGMQFDTTINRWHTAPNTGRINGSNPCCFVGETSVLCKDGELTIREMAERCDLGYELPEASAFDAEFGAVVRRPVVKAWVAGYTSELAEVVTATGGPLRCTPEHRFLLGSGDYAEARHLMPGALLRATDGTDRVVEVRVLHLPEPVPVFDLEVAGLHNFIVATTARQGVVVHNSEYMHLDNSACNLASLNLMKFLNDDGSFDVHGFKAATEVIFTAQEILVGNADYPTAKIAENARKFRELGIGYANLGALLMAQGLPYDSDAGRAWAATITALLTGHSYATSARIAARMGPFAGYTANRDAMLEVLRMHRAEAAKVNEELVPPEMLSAAQETWDNAVEAGEQFGVRNSQASVLAPTGCLVGGSLVATERGLVRLRSLGNPDGPEWQELDLDVATDNGPRPASRFYVNGLEHVVNVVTGRGHRIRGTTKHRIKVVDPTTGTWEWRRFSDLKPGDLVPLSLDQMVGDPQLVPLPPLPEAYWTGEHHAQVTRVMTPALAELVGYFMGDGSLHSRGLRFCVTAGDVDVVDRLVLLGKEAFGLEATTTPKKGYVEVRFDSVRLALWWEACGFAKRAPHADHTGKGYVAHIPDAVLHANDRAAYAAFLRGLFEADGDTSAGYPTLKNTSIGMVRDAQTLLLALGYPTTLSVKDRTADHSWGSAPLACLRLLNTSYAERWLDEVGFISSRKSSRIATGSHAQAARGDYIPLSRAAIDRLAPTNDRLRQVLLMEASRSRISRGIATELLERTGDSELRHLLSFFYDRVVASDLGDEEPTFDISVPQDVTYIANGFVSHNTIGLLMDCDTTGIEPDLSLVKMKKLVGGGTMSIVNQTVPRALERLGYSADEVEAIVAYIDDHKSIVGAPALKSEHLPVFACSMGDNTIHYRGHIRMMGAVQPFISGAISKTVNVPETVTVEDVEQLHVEAWQLGLKAVAIYRDNCKVAQPLATAKKTVADPSASPSEVHDAELALKVADLEKALDRQTVVVKQPIRERLPRRRNSSTWKFRVADCEGYVTVGEYEDGRPGEVFMKVSKQGSTLAGIMDAFSIAVSLGLQHGVPLATFVQKYTSMRFEPAGMTDDPDLRIAASLVDYIFRRLAVDYLSLDERAELGILTTEERTQPTLPGVEEITTPSSSVVEAPRAIPAASTPAAGAVAPHSDAPYCYQCGVQMVRAGSCHACPSCGTTSGCS